MEITRNIMDVLRERGFIKQVVREEDLYKLLGSESVPFYIGFDPTADSLHVGHFMQLMVMSYMQKAGHKPIVLIGGGTGKIGDPSGRSDMRQMMTDDFSLSKEKTLPLWSTTPTGWIISTISNL